MPQAATATAVTRAGINKNITPHVFRHTFGIWLYERTRDLRRAQKLMRHASLAWSMRYLHDTREGSEAANLMPKLATPKLKPIRDGHLRGIKHSKNFATS